MNQPVDTLDNLRKGRYRAMIQYRQTMANTVTGLN